MSSDEIVAQPRARSDSVETVIVGELDNNNTENIKKHDIIDLIDLDDDLEPSEGNNTATTKESEESFVKMLQNNTLMSLIVKKCLEAENSKGMKRIVDRSLQSAYKNASKSFKESPQFKKILEATLKLLELDPKHKFAHIKVLHDSLKLRQEKKRVPIITLTADLTVSPEKRSAFPDLTRPRRKRKKRRSYKNDNENNIIDLDAKSDDSDDIIFVDMQASNIQNIDSHKTNKEDTQIHTDNVSNQENDTQTHTDNMLQTDEPIKNDNDLPDSEVIKKHEEINVDFKSSEVTQIEKLNNTSNTQNKSLLVPFIENKLNEENSKNLHEDNGHESDTFEDLSESQREIYIRVKELEGKIQEKKALIDEFEQKEVPNLNSELSPYIVVDKWKREIVKLYEEICNIIGEEPVKKRTLRLQVQEGHPSGPVRRLEAFLNENLDSMGTPMFPDFHDVVMCVRDANFADNMWWTEAQVAKEARSLFKQCGDALRKIRQEREWRDMLSLVKHEPRDDDPADRDPALLAKLEENRRVAEKKESELLESFTEMGELQRTRKSRINVPQPYSSDSSDEDLPTCPLNITHNIHDRSYVNNQNTTHNPNALPASSFTTFCHERTNNVPYPVITCTHSLANLSNKIETPKKVVIPNHLEVPGSLTLNSTKKITPQANNVMVQLPINGPETLEPKIEVPNRLDYPEVPIISGQKALEPDKPVPDNELPVSEEKIEIDSPVKVKEEPTENVQRMLDALGSNFEATVFDIEDPFLIIEISSDSSSDEDL